VDERGGDPLQDAPGVASGGCRDRDSVRCAPRRVDVVESDGRRGDEAHPRTGEQRRVAPRAGTGQERVGVADIGGRNGLSGEITHLGERFQNPFQEGNGAVGYDFHGMDVFFFRSFTGNKYRQKLNFSHLRCRRDAFLSAGRFCRGAQSDFESIRFFSIFGVVTTLLGVGWFCKAVCDSGLESPGFLLPL